MRGRLLAWTVFAALATLAPGAPAAAAGDPILRLGQVQAGMQCTGYSVFRGTAVQPFDVEVLDVVGQNLSGGTATRLLVRVSGPAIDPTGVGPGFSGSPIYCPGPDGVPANIGAISETIGDYGGKTVFATPIEQILAVPVDAPKPVSSAEVARRASHSAAAGAVRATSAVAARATSGAVPGTGGAAPVAVLAANARARTAEDRRDRALLARARPLAGPVTIGGLGSPVFKALAKAAARRGTTLLQAPPTPVAAPAAQPFVPGSAVGVGMSSGDLAIGAVGTVAYVDGADTWAFGHSFDGAGARSLLLQDAYVATIVNNPVQSSDGGGTYKLAGPVNDVGTLSDDGFNAVAGRVGGLPAITPVHVATRDEDRGLDDMLNARVPDEADVGNPTGISNLSFVAPLAVTQAATNALGASPLRVAGEGCFRAVLREHKAPLRFCNRYVSDGTVSSFDGTVSNAVAIGAGTDLSAALGLLDTFKGADLHVQEVTARLSMTRAQRQAYLRSVTLPKRIRQGQTVRGRFKVKVVRGATRSIGFRWRVPRSLKSGRQRLTFLGSDPDASEDLFSTLTITLDDGGGPSDTEGPRTVNQLARAFRAFQRYDGIVLKRTGTRVFRDDIYRIGGVARTTAVVRHASK
jgi:hypothetical protein